MNLIPELWASFKSTVRGFDSPRQLALGLAFGVLIGLLPKDSLLPYAIGIIAVLTPGNLVCLAAGTILGSLTSPLLDGLTHEIGLAALTYTPLESTWTSIYQLPLAPWTRLNNTVLMGNLLLGLALMAPIYLVSNQFFLRLGPPLYRWLSNTSLAKRLVNSPTPQLQES